MNTLVNNMIRAAKLDVNFYEKAEADKSMFGQAMLVVVLSSIAGGIGSIGQAGLGGIVIGTILALVGWYVWAFLTYYIGTKFLAEPQTKADMGELLRTIGFSSAPGVLRILGIIPGLNAIVNIVAGTWMLVAMIVAVRQALDYSSTGRAVIVCIIGWIVQMIIGVLLFTLFVGGTA
jgi:hypothetical protein